MLAIAIISWHVRVDTLVYCILFEIIIDLAIDINLSIAPSPLKWGLVAQSLVKTYKLYMLFMKNIYLQYNLYTYLQELYKLNLPHLKCFLWPVE